MDTCENCGRTIGKLETPRVHEEHVVCAECWERLSTSLDVAPSHAVVIDNAPPPQVIIAMPHHEYREPDGPYYPRVQTIQQTGKFWKLLILIAVGVTVWGIVRATQGKNNQDFAIAVLLICAGLALLVFAKLGAWWFHG